MSMTTLYLAVSKMLSGWQDFSNSSHIVQTWFNVIWNPDKTYTFCLFWFSFYCGNPSDIWWFVWNSSLLPFWAFLHTADWEKMKWSLLFNQQHDFLTCVQFFCKILLFSEIFGGCFSVGGLFPFIPASFTEMYLMVNEVSFSILMYILISLWGICRWKF